MTELTSLTLAQARDALREKRCSALELADAHLAAIEQARALNAFVLETPERARDMARASDARLAKGEGGALEGLPLGVKDLFCTQGVRTTACSHILESFVPPYESTVSSNLWRDGAVLLGKLNNDEFAMGSSNENSAYGPVHNPHALDRVPGGSSGGSAAAVAAGMVVATLGTDTGGSIRQPASFCGVVGVLPTYGRVSRYGLIAFASSLDRIGPFAATVRDAATVLGVIAGHDPMDATSSPLPVPDYTADLDKGIRGMRIGVPAEYFADGLDSEVRTAIEAGIEQLRAAGAEIRPISLPHTRYAIPTYYVIATAEASSNLARFDGVRYGLRAPQSDTLATMYRRTRDLGFGAEVKRRILLGTYVLSHGYYDAFYRKAQQVRRLLTEDFLAAFREVDAIVTPTAPTPAFRIGEKSDDPVAMYLADIYTVTASLAGICGVSVPCGKSREGLPIGMQILGKHFDEAIILRVGQALEQALRD